MGAQFRSHFVFQILAGTILPNNSYVDVQRTPPWKRLNGWCRMNRKKCEKLSQVKWSCIRRRGFLKPLYLQFMLFTCPKAKHYRT